MLMSGPDVSVRVHVNWLVCIRDQAAVSRVVANVISEPIREKHSTSHLSLCTKIGSKSVGGAHEMVLNE